MGGTFETEEERDDRFRARSVRSTARFQRRRRAYRSASSTCSSVVRSTATTRRRSGRSHPARASGRHATRRTLDVPAGAEHGIHGDVGQPDPVDRAQLEVVLGDHTGAERRTDRRELEQPRMPFVERQVLAGDLLETAAPTAGDVVGSGRLVAHPVEHQVEQFGLGGDVAVQRHRPTRGGRRRDASTARRACRRRRRRSPRRRGVDGEARLGPRVAASGCPTGAAGCGPDRAFGIQQGCELRHSV